MFIRGTLILLLSLPSLLHAGCEDVIELSKESRVVVQGSSDLESAARAFCKEYASAKSAGKSMAAGGSYGPLSASFGESSASAEEVASKYCDASDMSKAKSSSYQEYVNTIAPGAYAAYNRCIDLQENGLYMNVDKSSIGPNYFAANVSYKTIDQLGKQIIDFAASPEVNCSWKNVKGKGSQTKLGANTADVLQCSRTDSSRDSSVQIFPISRANSSVSFKWTRFKNDLPVDSLQQLTDKVTVASNLLENTNRSIRNSVVGFVAEECPAGWAEYQPAQGLFLRGIDRGTKGFNDPDGKRIPGSIQGAQFEAHTHTRPKDVFDYGHIVPGSTPGGVHLGYTFDSADRPAPPTGSTGGQETRPKNVAVLYCIRQ